MKFKSFIYITLGYVLGQGSMFLAQTYLIVQGELELIGRVGIALGFLSLIQWLSDMGGVFLTSRYLREGRNRLASFLIARFVSFFVISLIYLSAVHLYISDEFCSLAIKYGIFIIFLGSINLTGLVDYLGKNQLAGPFSGLNWLFCAVALAYLGENTSFKVLGEVLGVSYLLGTLVSLIIQCVCTRYELVLILKEFKNVKLKTVLNVFLEGVAYNISFVASQSYGRMIPVVIDNTIGTIASGIFIYTRNITNMCGQLVMFARRVEFASLMELKIESFQVIKLFKKQMYSFLIISVFLLLVLILWFISKSTENVVENQKEILQSLVWLSVIFFSFNISSMFSQYLLSMGKMYTNSIVQSLSICLTFLFIYHFIEAYGLYSVYFSELLMHCLRIFIFVALLMTIRKRNEHL